MMQGNMLFILVFLINTAHFGQKIPFFLEKSDVFQVEFKNSVLVLSDKNEKGSLM